MTALAAIAGIVMWLVWCGIDHADDGVEVPLRRLPHRLGTAHRIDPGVRLAERSRR